MRKFIGVIITIPILLSFFRTSILAQDSHSTTLAASADATLVENDSTNYGKSSTLSCEHNGGLKVFVVRFDLGVIPSIAQIQSATLSLTQTTASGENISISAYKITSSWSETSISWSNKPTLDRGVTYGVLSVDASSGQKTFPQNFSDLVQSWLESPNSNFGLYFEATSTATYVHQFSSCEGANKPTLAVSYTIPDTAGPAISNIEVSSILSGSVTITWKTDEDASSFIDYGETTTYGKIVGSDDLSTDHTVVIDGLSAETTYHFRVRSEDFEGNKSESSDQTFTTLPNGEESEKKEETVSDKISPPTNLHAESRKEDGKYFIELSWEHSQIDVDGYRIYRSENDDTSYKLLTEVDVTKTSYTDEDIEEGHKYYYVVRSVKGEEESADSNEEVVTVYSSDLEEELHKLTFWKGFLILNLIIWPIFGFFYYRYKKKSKNLKLGK